jgi:predicted extracellular nuclease
MPRMAAIVDRASWLWLSLACAPSLDTDFGWGEPSGAGCSASLGPHDVQGPGSSSELDGQRIEVCGIATLARGGDGGRAGFFLQSTEPDDDELTSEGLFVAVASVAPAPGTLVRVRGLVTETAGMTALDAVERLEQCGPTDIQPVPLDVRHLEAAERWEGTWLAASARWTVVEASEALGSTIEASAEGRLYASGHELGSAAPASRPWTIESEESEGAQAQDARAPDALPPRLGSRLERIVGVLEVQGESRRLLTAKALTWPSTVPPGPERAREKGLRLAALNLDNYFLDLEGPGARTEQELHRQREKLVAALRGLDADILALTELENRGSASLADLLGGLDQELALDQRYVFVESSPPSGPTLRAGIAFRPARVNARGEAWWDSRPGFRRAPLFQSFEIGGRGFTLGVVHFKSKRCEAPVIVTSEGCGENARLAEAELLLEAARAMGQRDGGVPLLVLGDFNSDGREAPIAALERGGFVDLLGALPAADRYSYVFDGRASLLDHALGWGGFEALTAGAAIWHINADESPLRGYSLDNPPSAYAPDARRSSDHDPIIIDLHP